MAYSVIWTPKAILTYNQILDYLLENWPIKVADKFVTRTEKVISFIQQNPLLYPISKKKGIHKCNLVKQVTLFYKVIGTRVELILFWDTRQDPKGLFSQIK